MVASVSQFHNLPKMFKHPVPHLGLPSPFEPLLPDTRHSSSSFLIIP